MSDDASTTPPPNLRSVQCCATCAHHDGHLDYMWCLKVVGMKIKATYITPRYEVFPYQLCDVFEAKTSNDDD